MKLERARLAYWFLHFLGPGLSENGKFAKVSDKDPWDIQ
jgi:hypothetical protein